MPRRESRFEEVSRRTFLKRTAAFGVAAAFGLAACSDDADAFAAGANSSSSAATGATTTATIAGAATTEATTTSSTASASAIPSGSELAISFIYSANGGATGPGGGVRNPYVAVWVEDADGELVDTIALWFLQSQKGLRWLNELTRWYMVDGSEQSVSTVSSATRSPGDYAVVWDATDLDGSPVAQGEYFICIESAREHGPYSLIRQEVTLSDESFTQRLTDDEELSNASVQLTVA